MTLWRFPFLLVVGLALGTGAILRAGPVATDNFDDNAIDGTVWTLQAPDGDGIPKMAEVGGQLQFTDPFGIVSALGNSQLLTQNQLMPTDLDWSVEVSLSNTHTAAFELGFAYIGFLISNAADPNFVEAPDLGDYLNFRLISFDADVPLDGNVTPATNTFAESYVDGVSTVFNVAGSIATSGVFRVDYDASATTLSAFVDNVIVGAPIDITAWGMVSGADFFSINIQGRSNVPTAVGELFADDYSSSTSGTPVVPTVGVESGIEIAFETQLGFTYQVEENVTLEDGQWVAVGDPVAGTGEVVSIFLPFASDKNLFRVTIQ